MEDPITFDVWAVIAPGHKAQAEQRLHHARPELTRLQVLQAVTKSAATGNPLLLQQNVGWAAASECAEHVTPAFRELQLYQSGYGPDDQASMHWCPTHKLHYGGVLGCPVCRGDYVD